MDALRQVIESCYADWERAEEEHQALLIDEDEAK